MTLAACQKEKALDGNVGSDTQTITVSIPSGMQTKSTLDDFGTGASVNRCILQIYQGGKPYGERKVAAVENRKATFELRLVVGQTYDFVFWADKADGTSPADFADLHYTTSDLSAISVEGDYVGNNDDFDAFTGNLLTYEVKGAFSENITLKRPFGQLNVKTLDIDDIPVDALKPNKVKVEFTAVPESFNALTGLVSTATKPVSYEADAADAATGFMTVDYIWAPVEEAILADFAITFMNGATEISRNDAFTNIPIRRNYRTNVSGNLLTKKGEFNVTIAPEFENPDYDWKGDLEHAAQEGGEVILEGDVQLQEPLTIAPDKAVYLDLNENKIVNEGDAAAIIVEGELIIDATANPSARNVAGVVDGGRGGDNVAVLVKKGGKLTINGGVFTVGPDANGQGNSCIYSTGGEVYINGGEFSTEAAYNGKYYVLNLQNGSNGKIVCTGGKFENFDPSKGDDHDQPTNFVAEGFTSVLLNDTADKKIYEVVGNGTEVNVEVATVEGLKSALSNMAKANVKVTADIDLSSATIDELTLNESKTIDISEGKTIKLGNKNRITANKGIVLTGKGTIDNTSEDNSDLGSGWQKSLIHVNVGECIIDGVTLINDLGYHYHRNAGEGRPYNSAAVSYWDIDELVVKNNARILSGEFTLCGMGTPNTNVTLTDSYFESTSSSQNGTNNWAYALRLRGKKIRLSGCEVKGIQGGVSVEYSTDAEIASGKYFTVNSPGKDDSFYPLYVTSGAVVTITGGEFIAALSHSNLAEGTSAVVSGDNDTMKPLGRIILKGGKFSGKAYNHNNNKVYDPAEGFKWQAIENGGELKWEVIPSK